MATIRSVFSPGQTFNVLDPNAWVGGVVPGPNDIAQIGENGDYRATINTDRAPYSTYASPFSGSTIIKNSGSVIFPWDGNEGIIPVNSNAYNFNGEYQWPDTNGSFLIYPRTNFPDIRFPIKIDYISKSISDVYTFQSCSIDRTYSNWVYKTGSNPLYDASLDEKGYPKEIATIVRYNDYVYPLHTKFELTGSDTWHVGQIETLERCHFTVKDNAILKLDGTTVNPNAIYNNEDSYNNEIRILNNATVELTGSVQRSNAGLYFYRRNNAFNLLQISGSDLLPNTILSQSAFSGDSNIILTNTSSIGEGSIISIDNHFEPTYYTSHVWRSDYNPYGFKCDPTYPTSSTYVWRNSNKGGGSMFISGNFKEHEVVQVISQSNNNYTIAKLFGKEGKIQQDLGLFTYEQFVQTFSGSLVTSYSGQKRAVLIDSLHKDFQPGEKLIISRSKVAEVLYSDYYLSSSLYIDFTNGATTSSIHVSPYSGYTGSFIDVTTNSNYNLYYENYFRASQYWSTTPRTGSNQIDVTSSLHISSEGKSRMYQSGNPNYYAYFILPNTYFHEGEVSITYDKNTNLSGGSDTNAYLAINLGIGHVHNGGIPLYNSAHSYGHTYNYRNENRFAYGGYRNDGGSSNLISFRHAFPNSKDDYGRNSDNRQDSFKAKLSIKKGKGQSYLNGNLVTENYDVQTRRQPIKFSIYRNINIFDIEVKEYYQLVLLDTEESFNYKDEVLEGARLEYNQEAGKRVRVSGNRIKNPLGYRNLTRDLLENGKEATILPYAHSATTTIAQNGNYNSFYRWASNYIYAGELYDNYLRQYAYSHQYRKTGTGYYIIYDLQTETSMSSLAYSDYHDYNYDYTQISTDIQVDVSNDLENWTTVYGPTPDPRYTTREGQLRFYDFVNGSTSARFVKLYLNGTSRNSGNVIEYIGLYNFYDENNQDIGNTIELYNADMFEVGDKIFFQETKIPRHPGQFNYNNDAQYAAVDWATHPGVQAGTTTDVDVCGGLTYLHTITAKNGNRITLDRKIANFPIYKDTFIYKWNQGSINFKGNHTNLGTWWQRQFQYPLNTYQLVNANFDVVRTLSGLSGGGDIGTLNSYTENVSSNGVTKASSHGFGSFIIKNCNLVGGARSAGFLGQNNQYTLDTYDTLVFNNVIFDHGRTPTGNFGVRYASYINSYTFTYNRRSGVTIQYIALGDSSKNSSTSPKIKHAHNYIESTNNDTLNYFAPYMFDNMSSNYDNVIIKDNYVFFTYLGSLESPGGLSYYSTGLSNWLYNPNLERFKYYSLESNSLELHKSMYNDGSLLRINQLFFPLYYPKHPLTKEQAIVLGGSRSEPRGLITNPSPNTYEFYNLDYTGYNINNQANYSMPYVYYAKFTIHQPQDVKIYASFNYNRPNYFSFGGNSWEEARIRRGQYIEEVYYPRIILANALTKDILGKEELSSYGNNTVTYNKTHTLTPGDYIFCLHLDDVVGRSIKGFEHGPIDFNIFSTNPSQLSVYYSNWDMYKMFEKKQFSTKEPYTSPNAGQFIVPRASNTLPVGTLKIKKLKL